MKPVTLLVLRLLARCLAHSWRIRTSGFERISTMRGDGRGVVYALWHGEMLPVLWRHRFEGVTLLVSAHDDGGYLARVAKAWGYRVIRGSSSRRAVPAARAVRRTLESGGEVASTPDGPRGPARRAKPGLVWAAGRAGSALVAIGVRASSSWHLRSWDSFMIPRPFARVVISYSEPMRPAAREALLDDHLARLEQSLRAVSGAPPG